MPRHLLALLLLAGLAAPGIAPAQTVSVPRKGGVNDGDTIFVRDGGRTQIVRLLGVQAFELTTYNNADPRKWRGECHAVAAARFVLRAVRRSDHRVRLSSPAPSTDSIGRLIRRVEVRSAGRWRDLGAMLLTRGLVLWLHHVKDTAINERYNRLQQTAAARGVGIFDRAACGSGPAQDAALELRIMSDPLGSDTDDLNSEWVRVTNAGARAVGLGGWRLGNADRSKKQFRFPPGTRVAPGGELTVFTGAGPTTATAFHRGLSHTLFENSVNVPGAGDGAYLIDPDGDVRAHTVYPCRVACADPNQGALTVRANPIRGPEYADVRNVADRAIDLRRYQLRLPGAYAFPPGSVLAPGETLRVYVAGDPADDTRLVRHAGYRGAYLRDSGGTARVSTFDEIDLACDSWGSGRC